MSNGFLPQVEPYITDAERNAVAEYLGSGGWLTEFRKTQEFEELLASTVGARYAVVVTSGTVALYMALLAAGIGPGSRVAVPNYTMIATPNAVVKRLKFGAAGVTCCLDHLGEDGPECMTEGTIIYINRDHPLYKREAKKREAHILNIARLITQEISLMKDPANPREAYNRQSKLLRDAFLESDS